MRVEDVRVSVLSLYSTLHTTEGRRSPPSLVSCTQKDYNQSITINCNGLEHLALGYLESVSHKTHVIDTQCAVSMRLKWATRVARGSIVAKQNAHVA
jgi:hypothetical protein